MRKMLLVAVAALFACTINLTAQDTTHTLIKFKRPQYLGFYLAPEFQYGQLGGDFTTFRGGSAMLLLNKRFAIGVTGYGSTDNSYAPANVTPQYLRANFGGLKLEYTTRPNSAVHFSFPLVVGMASARQSTTAFGFGGRGDGFQGINRNSTQFVVVQPSVQIEANLLRYVKIFGGVNYRLMFDANSSTATTPVTTANVQGFSANVGLKMGLFNIWVGKKQTADNQSITN